MPEHLGYEAPPDRRWLKFVLLGGALLIMLVGFPLAWVGGEFYRLSQRQAIIDHIEQHGGDVTYLEIGNTSGNPPFRQTLMRTIFGPQCYDDVTAIYVEDLDATELQPAFAQFPRIIHLGLYDSELNDADIRMLIQLPLESITLANVRLTPNQLHQFSSIPSLMDVELSGTTASDEHLRQLKDLPQVTHVTISDKQLTAESLKPLSDLPELDYLQFETPEKPHSEAFRPLAQMKSVRYVFVVATYVDDSLIRGLSHLDGLEDFYCHFAREGVEVRCSPEALAELGSLSQLKHLIGEMLPVNDKALRGLCQAKQLEHLSCDGSQITDEAVPHLCQLKKLKYLTIPGAQLSDDSIRELAQLPALESLTLGDDVIRMRSNQFGLP